MVPSSVCLRMCVSWPSATRQTEQKLTKRAGHTSRPDSLDLAASISSSNVLFRSTDSSLDEMDAKIKPMDVEKNHLTPKPTKKPPPFPISSCLSLLSASEKLFHPTVMKLLIQTRPLIMIGTDTRQTNAFTDRRTVKRTDKLRVKIQNFIRLTMWLVLFLDMGYP